MTFMANSINRHKSYKHAGFTVMELMAVIAIVLLLTSVASIGIRGAIDASRTARAKHNARLLNEGIERFMSRGGDPTQFLNSTNPTVTIVDNLRSQHAKSLAFGGPFIDPSKGAKLATNGWRAVMISTNIQAGARTQIFFKATNSGTQTGIEGFEVQVLPPDFEPVGIYSNYFTNSQWSTGNAPGIRTSTITVVNPSSSTYTNSSSTYY